MAVTAGFSLILLVSLIALYKKLAPIERSEMLNATSKFSPDLVDQPSPGGSIDRHCVCVFSQCSYNYHYSVIVCIAAGISDMVDVLDSAEDSKESEKQTSTA